MYIMGFVDTFRQEEYTGENRCIACTTVNAVIAVFATVVLAAVLLQWFDGVIAAIGAGALLALSAASIWLRGYLVPKTPELTKRYMPRWMLEWFGKAPHDHDDGKEIDEELIVDTEQFLQEHGVVEPCDRAAGDQADLCLTDDFGSALEREYDGIDEGLDLEEILSRLDLVNEGGHIEYPGEAPVLVVEDQAIAQWPSDAALRADLAASEVLSNRVDDWSDMHPFKRAQVLGGVRLFLEQCPEDRGETTMSEETVESCCSTRDVIAVVCSNTEERLFEYPAERV